MPLPTAPGAAATDPGAPDPSAAGAGRHAVDPTAAAAAPAYAPDPSAADPSAAGPSDEQEPPPAAAPPIAPPPPGDLPASTFDAGPVLLERNERVNLTSAATGPLSRVMLDLAWQPAPGRLSVDLDASVIAFDASGQKLEIVWYQHQSEFAGALQHTGDAKGENSDQVAAERLLVDLGRLPEQVSALVFTINSFHGHTFTDLSSRVLRAQRRPGPSDRAVRPHRHAAEHGGTDGDLRRTAPGLWQMRAIGEYHDFRTVKKLVDPAARQVGIY